MYPSAETGLAICIKLLKGIKEIGQTGININAEVSCVMVKIAVNGAAECSLPSSRSLADVNYHSSNNAIAIYTS